MLTSDKDEVGGPLFRREGRHPHLTELGKIVRPRLEQAVSLTDIALSEAVEFFSQQAPQPNLRIHEASGRIPMEQLDSGELDVALVALPDYPEQFAHSPLFEERYVVAFPKDHRFKDQKEFELKDLNGERYLKRVNCEYLDFFEASGYKHKSELDGRFQSENESWVQAMVIAGVGCSIMPTSLARHPEVQHRLLTNPRISRTISIANVW